MDNEEDDAPADIVGETHRICPEYNKIPQFQYERILYLYNKHYPNRNGLVQKQIPYCGGVLHDFRPLGSFPAHAWSRDPAMPEDIRSDVSNPSYNDAWKLHGRCSYHVMEFRLLTHNPDASDAAAAAGDEKGNQDPSETWLHVVLILNEGDLREDSRSGRWGGAFVVHWKWESPHKTIGGSSSEAESTDVEMEEAVLAIDRLEPMVTIHSAGEWGCETTEVKQVESFAWKDHPNLKLSPFDFPQYKKRFPYEVGFTPGMQDPGKCTTQLEQLVGMVMVNWVLAQGTLYNLPEELECHLIDPETVWGAGSGQPAVLAMRKALEWEDQSDQLYEEVRGEDDEDSEFSFDSDDDDGDDVDNEN